MASGTKTNPSDVNGPNEYAGFVAPERPDASTIAGEGYYGANGEAPGNVVDRNRINKTIKGYDTNKTSSKPAGQPSQVGY